MVGILVIAFMSVISLFWINRLTHIFFTIYFICITINNSHFITSFIFI